MFNDVYYFKITVKLIQRRMNKNYIERKNIKKRH